jgi:hypothetical protein
LLVGVQSFGKLRRQRPPRLALDAGLAPVTFASPIAWVLLALVGSATAASSASRLMGTRHLLS